MRPFLLVALLTLLVAPVAAGAAPADTGSDRAALQSETTLSGTVSYLDGSAAANATVLVGSEDRLLNASESELREIAADPPEGVVSATTNESGGYEMTVGSEIDAETVVAVSADGVSAPRTFAAGEMDLTIRTTTALTFESPTVRAEPGGQVEIPFTLEHTGDQPVEGLSLSLTTPQGWNFVSASSESGTFHEGNRTFTWDTVEPGETVEASFKIFVAIGAINDSAQTYELTTFADSDSHPVSSSAMVQVRYPTEATRTEIPGFGLPAALLAVTALAGAALARRN
jgi:hypothetical protein